MCLDQLIHSAAGATDRVNLWAQVCRGCAAQAVAEVGVWKGEFAQQILSHCPSIKKYYLLDAWRQLEGWNKPANVSDPAFEQIFAEVLDRTAFAAAKRVVLRGTTSEVAHQIADKSLDFCYIDGDHTLRGIMIDLIRLYPKMRDGGIIGGDDFCPSAWQHAANYEPTLVFPAAVYFAQAAGSAIYGLPHQQFAILVDRSRDQYEFRDLTGQYKDCSVLQAIAHRRKTNIFRKMGRKIRALVGRPS